MRSTPRSLWKLTFSSLNKSEFLGSGIERRSSPSPYILAQALQLCWLLTFVSGGNSVRTLLCAGGGGGFLLFVRGFRQLHWHMEVCSYTVVTVIWKYCLHDTCNEFLLVCFARFMLGSYFTLRVDVFPLLSSLMRSWHIASSLLLNIQYLHGYLRMR